MNCENALALHFRSTSRCVGDYYSKCRKLIANAEISSIILRAPQRMFISKLSLLNDVYTDTATIATAKGELESGKIEQFGRRALTMAKNEGKGWFAILLGKKIDHQAVIPDYILDGVFFAHGTLPEAVLGNILEYRVKCVKSGGKTSSEVITAFEAQLADYRSGKIDLTAIRNAALASFPEDQIHRILARF